MKKRYIRGFEVLSEYSRPEKGDILINLVKEDLVLEIFIKPDAFKRSALPQPGHTGLRHLAFRVDSVEACLKECDRLEIPHQGLRYDDFDGKRWPSSLIRTACP